MEFQQKRLETEKKTQNIYRLFLAKTMKSVKEAAKDRALHLNKLKEKNIVKLVGTE